MDWDSLGLAMAGLLLAAASLCATGAVLVLGHKGMNKGLWALLAALCLMALMAALDLAALPAKASPALLNLCASLVLVALAVALRRFRQLGMRWPWLVLPPLAVAVLGVDAAAVPAFACATVLALQGVRLALELVAMRSMHLGVGYRMLCAAILLLVPGLAGWALGMGLAAEFSTFPTWGLGLQMVWLPLAVMLLALGFMRMVQDRREARSRRAALRDPLTRMLNRRAVVRLLERSIRHAGEQLQPLALLLVDVDHFKRVNDTYGHIAGDKVLRHISRVLACNVRSDAYLGRFGGEEFVVVCPDTGVEDAQILAERLSLAVRSSSVQIQGQALQVTVSIGAYAGAVTAATAWENVVEAADVAMYRAKDAGRDCVVMQRELSLACADTGLGVAVQAQAEVPHQRTRHA